MNDTDWILIDPISDKRVGEFFLATAKTNLTAGTKVTVQTWPITYTPVNRSDASGKVGASIATSVMRGNAGQNVIAVVIDSREFRPEPYILCIVNETEQVSAATWYNVSITPEENPAVSLSRPAIESETTGRNSSGLWIAVDPVPDTCLGDPITFHGTTDMPDGDIITTRVFGARYHCTKCQRKNNSVGGCCGDQIPLIVPVKRGNGGINTWSRVVNTSAYDFSTGDYQIDFGEPSRGIWNSSGFTVMEKQEPSRLWITVDPVPHHYSGDIITFHGTTNLPPGETIRTGVYSAEFIPCPKSSGNCQGNVTPCCGGYSDIVSVLQGTCGIGTWSWTVDTSQHGFRPDGEYIISASGRNGAVENTSLFTVSGIPKPNLTLNLPENDPDGNTLRFYGHANTGNGPEEKLFLVVSSDSGRKVSSTVPVFQNRTGYSWTFSLKKSDIVPYNFLSVKVSSATSPEIRIERTFLYNNEPVFYPYNPYSS
ncbi:MAG: hypothetical protein M0Q92_05085 [Methanoregula sp.]|jgi:hypothetical protein|nr:hypothetical protein [Methanoregula sp.]